MAYEKAECFTKAHLGIESLRCVLNNDFICNNHENNFLL